MSARRAQHGATNEGWPLTSGNTCIRPWLIPEADASEQPSHVVDHHHVVGEALFVEVLHIPAADVELEAGSPFVIRVKHRNGITVASHWHSFDENITVISGTWVMGLGEKFDLPSVPGHPGWILHGRAKESFSFCFVQRGVPSLKSIMPKKHCSARNMVLAGTPNR
jgi:anti-sigma factor ChrR (cupin superfamily)